MKTVKVGSVEIANDKPFVLVAGPCAMESRLPYPRKLISAPPSPTS